MSKPKEDSFISDEDEDNECPLCMEEFDLSDKNFKPCPCGYQVCQFCWNNIRNNPSLNGKCPACRRPYSEQTVEFKPISAEEWKSDHQKQTRLKNERKQREKERKENESNSRKHLTGMRVVQKNLVYVIGLNPKVSNEELHQTLCGNDFFGQYGLVKKIVISKRGTAGMNGNTGIGVYVTYYKKEDAAKCIAAVDGVMNDGMMLKANYGTTKYCSAYIRNQTCQNPQCMYLHEPGEEQDSFTRQDLSTYNFRQEGLSKQLSTLGIKRTSSQNNIASAIKPDLSSLERSGSSDGGDSWALPPTVSWANKNGLPVKTTASQPMSRASSNAQAGRISQHEQTSPHTKNASLHLRDKSKAGAKSKRKSASVEALFSQTLSCLANDSVRFVFSDEVTSSPEYKEAMSLPPFFTFDPEYGRKRREALEAASQGQQGEPGPRGSIAPGVSPVDASHSRRQSRYNFSDIANGSSKSNPHVAQQQSIMDGQIRKISPIPSMAGVAQKVDAARQDGSMMGAKNVFPPGAQSTSAPPPPPGILPQSNHVEKGRPDSSELLSHLMRGRDFSTPSHKLSPQSESPVLPQPQSQSQMQPQTQMQAPPAVFRGVSGPGASHVQASSDSQQGVFLPGSGGPPASTGFGRW